jgi:endonuclease IV
MEYKAGPFTLDKPKNMMKLLELGLPESCGFCVDTAHLFASGINITEQSTAKAYLEDIQALERPITVALNDQVYGFGKGRDQHASLCHGSIWGKFLDFDTPKLKKSGLYEFVKFIDKFQIPTILERREDSLDLDYQILQRLEWRG